MTTLQSKSSIRQRRRPTLLRASLASTPSRAVTSAASPQHILRHSATATPAGCLRHPFVVLQLTDAALSSTVHGCRSGPTPHRSGHHHQQLSLHTPQSSHRSAPVTDTSACHIGHTAPPLSSDIVAEIACSEPLVLGTSDCDDGSRRTLPHTVPLPATVPTRVHTCSHPRPPQPGRTEVDAPTDRVYGYTLQSRLGGPVKPGRPGTSGHPMRGQGTAAARRQRQASNAHAT